MKRHWLSLAAVALLIASPAVAGDPPASADASKAAAPAAAAMSAAVEHVMYTPADLKWADAPPGLPKGAKVAVLHGDPAAPGIFAMRIQLPSGYKVRPHFHPADENVTVLSGELYMAMGDSWDESKGHKLVPGAYSMMPKGSHHYAWTKGETVIQIHAIGPWGITYINPSDDPRNVKEAAK